MPHHGKAPTSPTGCFNALIDLFRLSSQIRFTGNRILWTHWYRQYHGYLPDDPNFVSKLEDKGVSITAKPTSEDVPSLLDAGFLDGGDHPLRLGPTEGIAWLKRLRKLSRQPRPTRE